MNPKIVVTLKWQKYKGSNVNLFVPLTVIFENNLLYIYTALTIVK